jgi:predicted HTH domain antitoxin
MTIELPDKALGNLQLTPEQARREIAVGLYAGGQISLGRAAQVAGQPKPAFQQELARRHICMNYSVEDAQHDIETVRGKLAA